MCDRWVRLVFLVGASLAMAVASAQQVDPVLELEVLEDLPVLARPKTGAEEISQLGRGDRVIVSPKIYGAYRKVRVTYKGRAQAGYVPIAKIRRSLIAPRDRTRTRADYSNRHGLGVAAVGSYLRQGETTFQLSDSTVYDTTPFSSFTFFFALFADVPVAERWGLRPYLSLRSTRFTGSAGQRDPPPAGSSKAVVREQSLTGLGLVAKRYVPSRAWWWGAGVEFAMGTKLELRISEVSVPTTEEDKPFFAIAYGALGANIRALGARSIYLVPDVRVGTIATTKPITFYLESFLALAYAY